MSVAVASDVSLCHVLQQTTTATDHQEQSTTRVVVMLVGLEVLGEIGDALGEHCHLSFRRSRVGLVQAVLAENDLLFLPWSMPLDSLL